MLSVGIVAYNQAHLLKQALDSVLAQEISHNYEIIICDDASIDGTDDIVAEYQKKYKDKISYIKNTERKGPFYNGMNFFINAKGKYLCWLEADDYWCYNKKIQIQLEFLENNPDYAGCFHDAKIISDNPFSIENSIKTNGQKHNHWKSYAQFNTYFPDFYPWDLLKRNIIPTASLVFRRFNTADFFSKFNHINLSLSWTIHLEIIKNSKFKYFNETWSVYYDHTKGFSKKIDLLTFKLNNIDILTRFLNDVYYSGLRKNIFHAIANEYFHLLHCNEAKNSTKDAYLKWCKMYKIWTEKAVKEEIKSLKRDFLSKK